jgi:PleD family two-component response regulator
MASVSRGDVALWLVLADPGAIDETTDLIRQLVTQRRMPVIVLGEDNVNSTVAFMQAGATEYLPHPINWNHLRFTVDHRTVEARLGVGPDALRETASVVATTPRLRIDSLSNPLARSKEEAEKL